jgi:hypothetical protein
MVTTRTFGNGAGFHDARAKDIWLALTIEKPHAWGWQSALHVMPGRVISPATSFE